MSNNPGAVRMIYETFSHRKSSNDIKVVLSMPAHDLPRLMAVLGTPPDSGQTKWVGVALIAGPAE